MKERSRFTFSRLRLRSTLTALSAVFVPIALPHCRRRERRQKKNSLSACLISCPRDGTREEPWAAPAAQVRRAQRHALRLYHTPSLAARRSNPGETSPRNRL